jgi:hypothetical protein
LSNRHPIRRRRSAHAQQRGGRAVQGANWGVSIERGGDGRRRFSDGDLDWLSLLTKLRATGMPVRDMEPPPQDRGHAVLGRRTREFL